jgi:hypothetical protein
VTQIGDRKREELDMSGELSGEGLDPHEAFVGQLLEKHRERCFGTPNARLKFLQRYDLPRLHEMLEWANSGIQGVPLEAAGYAHPDEPTIQYNEEGDQIYRGPEGHDRTELVDRALWATKRMDDLGKAGLLLGLTIVEARPFAEANEETARFATEILRHGFDGTLDHAEYYRKLLGNEGAAMLDLNTNVARIRDRFALHVSKEALAALGHGGHMVLGTTPFSRTNMGIDKLPNNHGRRYAAAIAEEGVFDRPMLLEYVARSGKSLNSYVMRRTTEGGGLYLNTQKLLADVEEGDADLLWEIYTRTKADYVESIIKCFGGDESIYSAEELVRRFQVRHPAGGGGGGASEAYRIYMTGGDAFHDSLDRLARGFGSPDSQS